MTPKGPRSERETVIGWLAKAKQLPRHKGQVGVFLTGPDEISENQKKWVACTKVTSMSEPIPNPFDPFFDKIREIVREEIKAASNGTAKGDRLLDPEEAAKLLSVSEDWLYHNAKKLPFTRKLGPRLLRFSYHGMLKWMESKKFGSV